MTKQFTLKKVFLCMATAGVVTLSHTAMAGSFALWEQDAASIGNYHAGVAAIADDASTAWYNPAGMIRIKNQELVAGGDIVLTNFRFDGTVGVSTIFDPDTDLPVAPHRASAQGGGFNAVPFLHYVAPINDCVAFGLSVDVPFGLKTDYGNYSYTRYASTLTSLQVIDITPSLAFAVNNQLSFGFGVDFQRLNARFNEVAAFGIPDATNDTLDQNEAWDWGYGWRMGALYQFTPETRVGLNYRSKVSHHATGNSTFIGPLARNGNVQYSNSLKSNTTLPAVTTLSVFHTFNPCWDVLGSVTYTQWNVFQNLILQNVAGIDASVVNTNNLEIDVPQHYHNVWNYSVGANFHPNEKWILRTGIGYDQSPANNQYRNLQLPDSDRVAIGLGAHYQATKCIGFDAGYTHIFSANTRIYNLTQTVGPEDVTTNGRVRASADVYGLQVKWDIA